MEIDSNDKLKKMELEQERQITTNNIQEQKLIEIRHSVIDPREKPSANLFWLEAFFLSF